jgi:hypothetical protein
VLASYDHDITITEAKRYKIATAMNIYTCIIKGTGALGRNYILGLGEGSYVLFMIQPEL